MKQKLFRHLSSIPGWRTHQKIVVIESDDWGSIRMPSISTYSKLKSAGVNVDSGDSPRYNQNDTLADAQDFEALYDTLRKVNKSYGKQPVITALSLVANPDFEKIKASNFERYHYESLPDTLKRYDRESALAMWREGIENDLFVPEFHGREHLNVSQWMRALQAGDKDTRLAFENGCWGFKPVNGKTYQAAFEMEYEEDLSLQTSAIEEGLDLFKNLHGFSAQFFVPPNGAINNQLEIIAAKSGINYMASPKIQKESIGHGKTRKHFRWLGKRNSSGQTYLTRNAFFEPNAPDRDWVDSCIKEIDIAFKWRKPAVISSHRTNYIGSLNEKNRKSGLKQLEQLLLTICKRWPDVEFMTSTELGNLITNKK